MSWVYPIVIVVARVELGSSTVAIVLVVVVLGVGLKNRKLKKIELLSQLLTLAPITFLYSFFFSFPQPHSFFHSSPSSFFLFSALFCSFLSPEPQPHLPFLTHQLHI